MRFGLRKFFGKETGSWEEDEQPKLAGPLHVAILERVVDCYSLFLLAIQVLGNGQIIMYVLGVRLERRERRELSKGSSIALCPPLTPPLCSRRLACFQVGRLTRWVEEL
jgi:hypothetical protein